MKLLTFDLLKGLNSIGIEAGTFVQIFQGWSKDNGIVKEWGTCDMGEKCFINHTEQPKCLEGSAVYLVRDDSSLKCIEENYDTSD